MNGLMEREMATRVKLAPRDTLFRKALRQLRIAAVFGLTALASNCNAAALSDFASA
jgi:hypothetical protein